MLVPEHQDNIDQSNEIYASRPLEQGKAWKEMVHRYAAGLLGLLILTIAMLTWKSRRDKNRRLLIPVILVVLVIFQALLGMWTVTLLLKPVVVMGHLLGGLTILILLSWVYLRERNTATLIKREQKILGFWPVLGMIVIYLQISLGGWTSANYAALICPDLPVCQGQWWPPMDFVEGFIPWRGLGVNYEFGVLDGAARTAIHMSHRIGAVLTLFIVGFIAFQAIQAGDVKIRKTGFILLAALVAQFTLGIMNILLTLPIAVAVTHNGMAALLLISMLVLLFHSRYSTV